MQGRHRKLEKQDWLQRSEAGEGRVGWGLSYSSWLEQGTAPLAGPGG